MSNVISNLYKVTIYRDSFEILLEAITDSKGVSSLYWLAVTSVQNIEDTWQITVMDLQFGSYYNPTKGGNFKMYEVKKIESKININKNIHYIKDMVKSLNS